MANSIIEIFPIWETIRSAGIISFILLSLSVIVGIVTSFIKNKKWKNLMRIFHQSAGWFGFLFAFLHMFLLLFDDYVGYTWLELLIPFSSDHERLLTGLGTLSFWGMFIILLSSDGLKYIGKKLWKKIHYLTIPTYIMSLIHGISLGTDVTITFIGYMYFISGFLFLLVIIARISYALLSKKTKLNM